MTKMMPIIKRANILYNEARDSKTDWALNVYSRAFTYCLQVIAESFSETDHSHIPSLISSASIKVHKITEESKRVTHGEKREDYQFRHM